MPKAKKGAKRGGGAKKRAREEAHKSEKKTEAASKKRRTSQKVTARRTAARTGRRRQTGAPEAGDPELFAPLTEGERADALRVLTEDKRLSQMAKVGRYRVISVEPLTVKPPEQLTSRRLARVVVYDYAGDRCVDAAVDLDESRVAHLRFSKAQPMLAREEEGAAIAIALADERVKKELSLGDEPQVAMHYWSNRDTDLAFTRRSAAVLFGRQGERPSMVAVVDLLDAQVTDVVPAGQW